MNEENEQIQDYYTLKQIKPIKNKFIKPKTTIKKEPIVTKNIDDVKELERRITNLELSVKRLEKLTKYLDYVRSINTNKK